MSKNITKVISIEENSTGMVKEAFSGQYIGTRKVKSHKKTKETTPGGTPIVKVEYEDGLVEHLSTLMFDKVISNEPCDETNLRKKRVLPVMEQVLMLLREWGMKASEMGYFSQLLNDQLEFNKEAAYIKLVSEYMPKPLSLDDVDLITLDRILRNAPSKK